jgi:uncharacterized protein YkwD
MARRLARFLLVPAALALCIGASPASARTHGQASAMGTLQSGVLADINATRREHGLGILRLSVNLSAAARQHSVEMATRGYFSHNSANGVTFDRRIAKYYPLAGTRYWSVGENLLWSSPDVDAATALNMWMNSPDHRANILSPRWRQIGISAVHVDSAPGFFGNGPVTVITTDFGVRH